MGRPARETAASFRNRILASLPGAVRRELQDDLTPVPLELKSVIHDVDAPIRDVYFVETGIVSVLAAMTDGTAVEVATVGSEGFIGLPVALGNDRSVSQSVVQVAGEGFRMPARAFRKHFEERAELRATVNRYAQATFTLLAQSSACNRLHSIRERCARWLLTTSDRLGASASPLRHEFLAQMLGVRRASVSDVLSELRADGVVATKRARIDILQRRRLEQESCECYWIVRSEYERLLDGKDSSPLLARIRRRVTEHSGVGKARSKAHPPRSSLEDEHS